MEEGTQVEVDLSQPRSSPCGRSWQQECGGESGGITCAGAPRVAPHAHGLVRMDFLRSRAAETSAGMPRENDGGLALAERSSVPKVRHQAPTSILYSMMRIMIRTSTETSVPDDMFLC